MKKELKILNIFPFPVYPLKWGGGAVYSFFRSYYLVKKGHKVDFVTMKLPDTDYSEFEKMFQNNIYIKKKSKIKSLFSIYPYSFERFKPDKNELNQIIDQIYEKKYNIVIFEYPFSYFFYQKLYNILRALNIKIVYVSHDIEYLYAFNTCKATSNVFYKLFFYFQYLKLKKYEPLFLSKDFDLIISISKEDVELLKTYNPKTKVVWIPPIIPSDLNQKSYTDLSSLSVIEKFRYKILFVGWLEGLSNLQAVEWFAEKVMPLLRRKVECCFIVAGKKPEKKNLESRIKKLTSKNNDIFVFFSPESMEPFYKISDLVVIPIFNNAGVKIKLIEALRYGKKVVARPEGVYGSGLERVVPTAETPEEFAKKCIDVLEDKIDYSLIWRKFDEIYRIDKLVNLLEKELSEILQANSYC